MMTVETLQPYRSSRPDRCRTAGTAVAVLALAASVATATPVSAATRADGHAAARAGVTFGVQPVTVGSAPTRPDFAFGATAGALLRDRVVVLNYSDQPLALQMYATDALNTPTGGFGLLPVGTHPAGVGSWIALPARESTVHVPAQTTRHPGQVVVPFTLRVPRQATPGDHVGGIVASLRTEGHNSTGQNVILNQRVATRVFVRVAGTLTPRVAITDLNADYHGSLNPFGRGSAVVTYRVKNAGNVEYGFRSAVTVSGPFGVKHVVAAAPVPLVLPGDSVTERVRVSGVWPQVLDRATVRVQPVAAPGDTDPQLPAVSASTRFWAIPWAFLLLILLVLLIGLLTSVVRRRRSATRTAQPRERVSA
jgi:hypothetical protein